MIFKIHVWQAAGRGYQNIFPLANTFAKRENVRLGQSPKGTQMVSFWTFLYGVWARH